MSPEEVTGVQWRLYRHAPSASWRESVGEQPAQIHADMGGQGLPIRVLIASLDRTFPRTAMPRSIHARPSFETGARGGIGTSD